MEEEDDDCENPVRWHYELLRTVYDQAVHNEDAIATSIVALDRVTADLREQASALPATVSDQVATKLTGAFESAANAAGDRLVEKFTDANVKAAAAAALYERAAKFCFWRVAGLASWCALCGVAAMVATASFILPDARTLQKLRSEQAQLESNIDNLKRQGGEVEIRTCGKQRVPCFRTNEREFPGPFRREGETYRMIYRP